MSYYGFSWRPSLSAAERRQKAATALAKLRKTGQAPAPVTLAGRVIATSFWGTSWCANLERYSDFESRLPRGRTYVRNGFVIDLRIAKGKVSALVSGSDLYTVTINVAPVATVRWKAIRKDCAGSINSLVELLQGRLAASVMERVCRQGDGLFPAPGEIEMSCSCPDWANLCKHVAATLYGVGARLDEAPELLFELRGVDEKDLLSNLGQGLPLKKAAPARTRVLDESDIAAVFGLDMAEGGASPTRAPSHRQRKAAKSGNPLAVKTAAANHRSKRKRA